jgi:hypothetical protein
MVELIIVLAMAGLLAAALAATLLPTRRSARTLTCVSKLRQIATAVMIYHAENGVLATPDRPTLPVMLAGQIADPRVFVCPFAPASESDSYSRFYVPQAPAFPSAFLVGCANHAGDNMTPAAFGAAHATTGKSAKVTWDGKETPPGGEVQGGTLRFADGTTVQVPAGMRVVVLVSFEESQGRIYSALRVPAGAVGTISVEAASGAHFDIATPACTAGVRGTKFTVKTSQTSAEYVTQVDVSEGTVVNDAYWPVSSQRRIASGNTLVSRIPREARPPVCSVTGPSFKGAHVTYSLRNTGGSPLLIGEIALTWPATNRQLETVALGGQVLFNGNLPPSTATLSADALGPTAARTLAPGQQATLEFTFHKDAANAPTGYTLSVSD